MASHEIALLKCPSCGGATTGPSKPLAFGAEFLCAHCGSTSVLIINRSLLPADALQKSGDQVCAVCGRVAKLDARFCQDGHKLVRKCLNNDCHKEFPAHHQRCDYCGWDQDLRPGTPEAVDIEVERAIQDLTDLEPRVISKALQTIGAAGKRGKKAIPSIVTLLRDTTHCTLDFLTDLEMQAWYTLAGMEGDAVEVVPLLLQRINDKSLDRGIGHHFALWNMGNYDSFSFCKVLAIIAPQEILPLCRNVIDASGKRPQGYNRTLLESALAATAFIGKPAIPMLLEFCGAFSGSRGAACQETVNQISEKGRRTLQSAGYRTIRCTYR